MLATTVLPPIFCARRQDFVSDDVSGGLFVRVLSNCWNRTELAQKNDQTIITVVSIVIFREAWFRPSAFDFEGVLH